MAAFRARKVVSALPTPLEPDTLYAVRVGEGFDLYISDNTGTLAHKVNGGAAGGWTTISSVSIPSTNTIVFSSIPSSYNDLAVVLKDAWHIGSGSRNITLIISGDNGSTIGGGSTYASLSPNTLYTSGFQILNRKAGAGMATFANASISASAGTDMNTIGMVAQTMGWQCGTGPINYLRIGLSSSQPFIAYGTATLYGRV